MATSEISPRRYERRSLFRSVRWLRRDAVVGICLWLVFLGGLSLPWWTGLPQSSPTVLPAAYPFFLVGVLLSYPAWVIRRRTVGSICFWPGTGRLLKEFAIAVPMTLCLLMLNTAVSYAWKLMPGNLQAPSSQWADFADRAGSHVAVILAIVAVTLGPLVEEVFYRGFLYNALRCVCPVALAICLQSVLFGVSHFCYYPAGIVQACCVGLVLAGIYEWRKTLLAPIFVHSMYNCAAMFAIGIAIMANAAAPVLGVHGARDAQGQLVVDQVLSGTGAEKADLRPGDVILSYNDVAVSDLQQLVSLVCAGRVGDTVRIEVIREGARFERQIMLGARREASRRPTAPAR